MKKNLTIIAGKDPLEETGAGHSSYLRAHARAAIRIGFEPHLFCVGYSSGIVETDYGIVQRFSSPLRHLGKPTLGKGIRVSSIPIHDATWRPPLKNFWVVAKAAIDPRIWRLGERWGESAGSLAPRRD